MNELRFRLDIIPPVLQATQLRFNLCLADQTLLMHMTQLRAELARAESKYTQETVVQGK